MTGQYFSPTMAKPIAESTPLIPQMTSCPRTTPERPLSTRTSSASKLSRRPGADERPKNATMRSRVSIVYAASISVMKKTKMRAADPGDEVAERAGHLEGVLLGVGEGAADGLAHDPVEVERWLLPRARRLEVPPAVRGDDAHAGPHLDGDRIRRVAAARRTRCSAPPRALRCRGRGVGPGRGRGRDDRAQASRQRRDPPVLGLVGHLGQLVAEIPELVPDARRDGPREGPHGAEDERVDAEHRHAPRHLPALRATRRAESARTR